MKRLTEKCSTGYELVDMTEDYCDTYCKTQDFATCRDCAIHISFNRLGKYEDTKLQPEGVEKLKGKYKELQKENKKLKAKITEMLKYAWYKEGENNVE